MLYFSSLLETIDEYRPAGKRLFATLEAHGIPYGLMENTRDIWMRDFMPVRTRTGNYVSFRYEPSYLKERPDLQTDFRRDMSGAFPFAPVVYSHINLDGGNVVFSPSKTKAVISDRVFSENADQPRDALVEELERLLEAKVILIPSLPSDMTGHADGMVRFVDETTVVGNRTPYRFGLEARIRKVLEKQGLRVVEFPYFGSPKDSAAGCYLNFLETEQGVLLPVFGVEMDSEAVAAAESVFRKPVIPVNINEVAEQGGVLNCISWEAP